MGEMFKQRALAQQRLEHLFAIIAVTRPQDMILRPHDIAYRVDLQKAQPPDDRHHIHRTGRHTGKIMGRQPQTPQMKVGNGDGVCRLGLSMTQIGCQSQLAAMTCLLFRSAPRQAEPAPELPVLREQIERWLALRL